MDTTQLAQMVTWLDEQHRRDRGEIARLQQRVEAQTNDIQEQSRRIQELEARLTSTQTQLARIGQYEQSLQNMRNELVLMVQGQVEESAKTQRDFERSRMGDRETFARGLDELRKQMGRIRPIEEELVVRKAEDQRLSEALIELRQAQVNAAKDVDERTRGLPYLMEQRGHDNKRIVQLQQENVELFKRVEEASSKVQMLDQKQQKTESQVRNLPPMVESIKRGQEQFVDSLKIADADRQRQMKEWQQTFTAQATVMEESRKRVQEMAGIFEQVKRALAEVERFQTRIQSDQNQVAELQRLNETRLRKEMETFLAENEKRWKKQLLEWQYQWDQQTKTNAVVSDRFIPIGQQLAFHGQILEVMWRYLDASGAAQLKAAQKWLDDVQKFAEQRQDAVKAHEEAKAARAAS